MVAIAVGVGQEDDLAVTQPRRIILIVHAAAKRAHNIGELLVIEDLRLARLLGIEDLPLERKDRLNVAIASLLRRPARRVALDDEEL